MLLLHSVFYGDTDFHCVCYVFVCMVERHLLAIDLQLDIRMSWNDLQQKF